MQPIPDSKYGKWTVVCYSYKGHYLCECECGELRVLPAFRLIRGETKSCGCSRIKHGHAGRRSPTYFSWENARKRCYNPSHKEYRNYGGRGITMCDRWKSFQAFLGDMGVRPQGKTIDRINVEGNYEPGNCRWSDPFEQASNKR